MKLIDADALKEAISKHPLIDFTDDDIFELIDKAPTVETYTKEDMRKEADLFSNSPAYSESTTADCLECAKEHEQLASWLKELKGLRLLLDWAIECGFGYDNFPEEYEKYKEKVEGMGYKEGIIFIGRMEAENEADN